MSVEEKKAIEAVKWKKQAIRTKLKNKIDVEEHKIDQLKSYLKRKVRQGKATGIEFPVEPKKRIIPTVWE